MKWKDENIYNGEGREGKVHKLYRECECYILHSCIHYTMSGISDFQAFKAARKAEMDRKREEEALKSAREDEPPELGVYA